MIEETSFRYNFFRLNIYGATKSTKLVLLKPKICLGPMGCVKNFGLTAQRILQIGYTIYYKPLLVNSRVFETVTIQCGIC